MSVTKILYKFGQEQPQSFWTPFTFFEFTKMINSAKMFDSKIGEHSDYDEQWLDSIKKSITRTAK